MCTKHTEYLNSISQFLINLDKAMKKVSPVFYLKHTYIHKNSLSSY